MAKAKTRIRSTTHPLNLAIQAAHIHHRFLNFVCRIHKGRAVWRGTLQPRMTSPLYQVEISYRLMDVPKVRIISPPLASNTPHLYPDGSLCLYWPKEWRWRQDQLIAETILPWAALWLYYYELWLDTDQWLGPSSHHPVPEGKICQPA
jgi:hypothetical protein